MACLLLRCEKVIVAGFAAAVRKDVFVGRACGLSTREGSSSAGLVVERLLLGRATSLAVDQHTVLGRLVAEDFAVIASVRGKRHTAGLLQEWAFHWVGAFEEFPVLSGGRLLDRSEELSLCALHWLYF